MRKRIDLGTRVAGDKGRLSDEFVTKSQLIKSNGGPLDVAANGDLIVPAALSDHLVLADAGITTDTAGALIDKIIGADNTIVVSTDITDPNDVQLVLSVNPSAIDVNQLADEDGLLDGGSSLPTGTANQTLRHNGTDWVANDDLRFTVSNYLSYKARRLNIFGDPVLYPNSVQINFDATSATDIENASVGNTMILQQNSFLLNFVAIS